MYTDFITHRRVYLLLFPRRVISRTPSLGGGERTHTRALRACAKQSRIYIVIVFFYLVHTLHQQYLHHIKEVRTNVIIHNNWCTQHGGWRETRSTITLTNSVRMPTCECRPVGCSVCRRRHTDTSSLLGRYLRHDSWT